MKNSSWHCEAGKLKLPHFSFTPRIGVLALQGAVEKHLQMLARLEIPAVPVKYKEELKSVHALIIPGGESTTIGKLLMRFKLFHPIQKRISQGMPVFGTCAGMILLAKNIIGFTQPSFKLLDITIDRNAYGPQIESFEADIQLSVTGEKPFRAVFIRAPIIREISPRIEVLGSFEGNPVLIRQDNIMACTFHPELTDDERLHRYFAYHLVSECIKEGCYQKN
jgi:5'-phosphate synthase pdxT subunit